jgi:hypothetical protein
LTALTSFHPQSSILNPQSSILHPQSSIPMPTTSNAPKQMALAIAEATYQTANAEQLSPTLVKHMLASLIRKCARRTNITAYMAALSEILEVHAGHDARRLRLLAAVGAAGEFFITLPMAARLEFSGEATLRSALRTLRYHRLVTCEPIKGDPTAAAPWVITAKGAQVLAKRQAEAANSTPTEA